MPKLRVRTRWCPIQIETGLLHLPNTWMSPRAAVTVTGVGRSACMNRRRIRGGKCGSLAESPDRDGTDLPGGERLEPSLLARPNGEILALFEARPRHDSGQTARGRWKQIAAQLRRYAAHHGVPEPALREVLTDTVLFAQVLAVHSAEPAATWPARGYAF
jgi:hypothetical protein